MKIPAAYDDLIFDAARQYLPEIDWKLLKAQLYQESWLRPNVDSPAGAQGIAQFMPRTWAEVRDAMKMPAAASPYDPGHAIPAAAFYMRRMRRGWGKPEIAREDLHRFALASYNAGIGNITKAWRLAGKPAYWSHTADVLDKITGKHAEETKTYVQRVYRWHDQLLREGESRA